MTYLPILKLRMLVLAPLVALFAICSLQPVSAGQSGDNAFFPELIDESAMTAGLPAASLAAVASSSSRTASRERPEPERPIRTLPCDTDLLHGIESHLTRIEGTLHMPEIELHMSAPFWHRLFQVPLWCLRFSIHCRRRPRCIRCAPSRCPS